MATFVILFQDKPYGYFLLCKAVKLVRYHDRILVLDDVRDMVHARRESLVSRVSGKGDQAVRTALSMVARGT